MSALPPLRSLEAFRAVMRQGSFTAAAEALGLTPAAVSHRIRELERVLGSPLFERRNRAVFATDAARRYHEALQEGFQRLEAATRIVSQPADTENPDAALRPQFRSAMADAPAEAVHHRASGHRGPAVLDAGCRAIP